MDNFMNNVWSLAAGLIGVFFVALIAMILVLTVVAGIKAIRKEWRK